MRFSNFCRHAVGLVPTEREKIRRFINGLNHQFHFVMNLGNIVGAKFDEVVDNARRLEMDRTHEREEMGAKGSRGLVQSSSHAPSVQGLPVPGSSSSYSGSRGPTQYLPPLFVKGCFDCGDLGHMKRNCPRLLGGPAQQRSQVAAPALVNSPPAQPERGGAQTAKGRSRGGGRSGGGQA
ncbi:uncharacterized protein [Nicotiana tomentosiformis]|uniref:uncharacterized protein n=1 Tax=Nicotiana tomentosiformis TaxID=4098 RepID=UPI00388C9796